MQASLGVPLTSATGPAFSIRQRIPFSVSTFAAIPPGMTRPDNQYIENFVLHFTRSFLHTRSIADKQASRSRLWARPVRSP